MSGQTDRETDHPSEAFVPGLHCRIVSEQWVVVQGYTDLGAGLISGFVILVEDVQVLVQVMVQHVQC
jgi:hypothetical protein